MNRQKEEAWQEAKRRCRLTDEDVRMAKELGFQPKSLIKNIPAPSQQWKSPVNEWVRSLYEEKIGSRKPRAERLVAAPPPVPLSRRGEERRNAENPWPDHPEIPDLPPLDLDTDFLDYEHHRFEPPDEAEVEAQNGTLLRRQRLFRWAAEAIAAAVSTVPEVEKVAAFGAVAQPLKMEVPRFRQYRRYRIEVLHECADLDLAIWLRNFENLKKLKRAMSLGLEFTQDTPYGGVAHHQVDVHLFDSDSGQYRGRLCYFGECPKPRKRECLVPECGAQPFLRQFEGYRFRPETFEAKPKVVLLDRSAAFLVPLPTIDAKPREVRWTPDPEEGEDDSYPGISDDDVF